jgi:hypothetical protein
MSVVLRCPNCGTTQGHVGECEACSDAEVQYFCTNHDEGIWLDSPVCGRCGAKFGDAPRKPTPAPTRRLPTRPAPPPDFRPPVRPRAPERMARPEFGAPPPRRPPDDDEPVEGEVLPRTPSLGELLEEITDERARARERYEVEEARSPWAGVRVRGPGLPFVAGCLVRVLGLGFLLFVAFVIFLYLLFGGFIVD